jgi:hypothetical protein
MGWANENHFDFGSGSEAKKKKRRSLPLFSPVLVRPQAPDHFPATNVRFLARDPLAAPPPDPARPE